MKKSEFKKTLQNIFKTIFYNLFKIKHGKIRYLKDIQVKLFEESFFIFKNNDENIKYSIFLCTNYRLYTNRIQDTAVIKNNILLDKPSFQLRDNKFDQNIKKT